MYRFALVLLFVVAALAKPAGSGVMPGKRDPDPEVGRRLWKRGCWQCHGETGKGDGPAAASLLGGVPPFEVKDEGAFPELVDVVQKGRGRMPAYAEDIDKHDSRRILVYLLEVQSGRMDPTAPAKKDDDADEADADQN